MSNGEPQGEMGAKAQSQLKVRLGSGRDRADQETLFRASFGVQEPGPVLAWRYDRCPHGVPVTLIGSVKDQAVAGYACNQRRLGWEGDGIPIGQTGDVMTLASARGKGYFSALDREAMRATGEAGWPVVFGLPNRQSAPLFLEKLGWLGVGRLRPWTFVCRNDGAARAERLRAGRWAALGTGWAYRMGRRRLQSLGKRAAGMRAEPIERFEDWVEGPAREVARSYPWMVRRDAAYLNWRFFDAPNGRFAAWRLLDARGNPAGYVVVQRPGPESNVGYLVDLVAPSSGAHAAGLRCALEQLAAAGASVVRAHAIEGSDWQAQLTRAGFRAPKREDEKWVIAYLHQSDHPAAQWALDAKRWFFTDADRDDELVR